MNFKSIIVTAILFAGISQVQAQKVVAATTEQYGKTVNVDQAIPINVFTRRLISMEKKEMSDVVVKGTVSEICTAKGCWMTLRVNKQGNMRVMFDDHRSFATADLIGKEVIVKGDAKVVELTAEEIEHYKEDAGKNGAEVPEQEVMFTAKAVVLP